MRTRTKRWLLIGVLLSVPVATVSGLTVKVIEVQQRPSRLDTYQGSPVCDEIQALKRLDPSAAIAQYRALVNAPDSPTDSAKALKDREADRICAAAKLRQLLPPTLSDRTFQVLNGVVNWVGRLLANRPVSLGDNPSLAVVWSALAVEALLTLLAGRQFLLWRRERLPGPVSVGAIIAPQEEQDRTGLGEIIRERLARAGVAPGTAAPGELGALVVDAVYVLGGESNRNWLSESVAALSRAVRVTSGFTVTGKAFPLDADQNAIGRRNPEVTLEIKVARTGATLDVVTGTAATYEEAAVKAAYYLFLRLTGRPSIVERTPSWLAWNSEGGLSSYHDALTMRRAGSIQGALDHLDRAALLEPGNLLVYLSRGWCERQIALGGREDNTRRGKDEKDHPDPEKDSRQRRFRHMSAARDFLQATLCAPGNDDAIFETAIELSYVDSWFKGMLEKEEKNIQLGRQIVSLTEAVCREIGVMKRGVLRRRPRDADSYLKKEGVRDRLPTAEEIDEQGRFFTPCQVNALVDYFREVSIDLWRHVVKHQRLPRVARRSLRLAYRIETRGRSLPFSGLRLARRYGALAGRIGTEWDRTEKAKVSRPGIRLKLGVLTLRVRLGRYLTRHVRRRDVSYNLAALYARKAAAQAPSHGTGGNLTQTKTRGRAEKRTRKAEEAALKYLKFFAIGRSSRLAVDDVDMFRVDPCFSSLIKGSTFKEWVERFGPETDKQRKERIWGELAKTVRDNAAHTRDAWDERKLRLLTGTALPTRTEMINWFRHDEAMWNALVNLSDNPSVIAKRTTFQCLADSVVREAIKLEPAAREAVELEPAAAKIPIDSTKRWQEITRTAREHACAARGACEKVESFVTALETTGLRSYMAPEIVRAAARWALFLELRVSPTAAASPSPERAENI